MNRRERAIRGRRHALVALVLAGLLHLCLLLIPTAEPPLSEPEFTLDVSLVTPPPEPVTEPAVIPDPEVAPPPPESQPTEAPQPQPEPERTAETEPNQPEDVPVPDIITRARLLESVAEMEWTEPDSDATPLARSVESELWASLSKPVLQLQSNEFDDVVLPTEVEVLDRWLEPSGVHRVVIKTPTGHTLCGRQEPVDDFRPWTQMPMLFGKCAGGGKRTFKAPEW